MPVPEPRILDRAPEPDRRGLPPLPVSGVQVASASVDSDQPEYVFVSCNNGVYWVFRERAEGPDVEDSGHCFGNVAAAALNAGDHALRHQLDDRLLDALNSVVSK